MVYNQVKAHRVCTRSLGLLSDTLYACIVLHATTISFTALTGWCHRQRLRDADRVTARMEIQILGTCYKYKIGVTVQYRISVWRGMRRHTRLIGDKQQIRALTITISITS